eukprot:2138959-Alexandrium_andersonii.AAC.1
MRPAPRADPREARVGSVTNSAGAYDAVSRPPGPHFRASTFQYHPSHLVFSREGAWHDLHP